METVGQKLERLKADLKAAQDARDALSATDTAGIATTDKTIAALNRQIDALSGTEKAEKASTDAAQKRQQVLDDIAKAEAERARRGDTPEQKEMVQAGSTRDDRVEKAKGDADLLLKIEAEYQAQVTEIQTRYAAERFAQRQQAEDDAEKFIADQRTAAASAELQQLQAKQAKELAIAIQGGDDLTALMQRQSDERQSLTQTLRDAEVQKINDTYEAQYAALDAAGASTLELQAQHGADLNALNEQFRLEDEANAQASVERKLQAEQAYRDRQIQDAQDLVNAYGAMAQGLLAIDQAQTENKVAEIDARIEAAKKEGKDTADLEAQKNAVQKDAAREAFQIQRAITLAQLAVDTAKAISSLTAASAGNPLNAVTVGAAGAAQFAAGIIQITANMAQAIALLSKKAPGFAQGGTVPEQRGTVTSTWGRPVRRANGDNVLVTLKSGEKVLNEEQQKRLEAIAGKSIWGAIRLPGHSMTDAMRRMRHGNLIAGYAEGGTVGIVTPRPAPQTVVQNQFVQSMAAYSDRPMFVSVREINDVQGRVTVTETLGSL